MPHVHHSIRSTVRCWMSRHYIHATAAHHHHRLHPNKSPMHPHTSTVSCSNAAWLCSDGSATTAHHRRRTRIMPWNVYVDLITVCRRAIITAPKLYIHVAHHRNWHRPISQPSNIITTIHRQWRKRNVSVHRGKGTVCERESNILFELISSFRQWTHWQ